MVMRKSLFYVSLCASLAWVCYAKIAVSSDAKTEMAEPVELKATIAHGDAAAGKAASAVCAGCHGVDGRSAIAANPSLAGQGAPYIVKQLNDFKSGARENAIMAGMVATLDDTAMDNLAAYYAEQTPAPGTSIDNDDLKLGRDIYRGGIASIGVPACASCHAPDGSGNDAALFPRIGGQHADYIALSLKNYRSGARANDANKMMRTVAARLSDQEIAALANYIQGLY